VSCCCEKLVADAGDSSENPEEGGRLRLEAVAMQRQWRQNCVIVNCKV
jgi:hypothetical protein